MDHHYALTKIIDGLYVGDHATLQVLILFYIG